MDAKEKAKKLVEKYLKEIFSGDFTPTSFSIICAKQCALIAVDEILNALNTLDVDFQMNQLMQMQNEVDYWQQVLEEIEKL